MSSSKKRHKEILKRHKARKKRMKERLREIISSEKRFMFQDYLVNCEDVISQMVPAEGVLFRLAHNPNIEIDIFPTSLWNYDSLTPKITELPDTIPVGSTIDEQQEQVREYLPSFNVSDEGAIAPFVDKLNKMKTSLQLLSFKNKKGSHVFAYDVQPEDGRMWIEPNGHALFQPYEGFKLADHVASDFIPIPIENYIQHETE